MPFLAYAEACADLASGRVLRGSSPAFWDLLSDLAIAAEESGLGEVPVPKRILDTGPCPGLWRIYYTLTQPVQEDLPVDNATYLGYPTTARTKRQLGKDIERWVNQANAVANDFLRSHATNPAILNRIQVPLLKEFYLRRMQELVLLARTPSFLETCVVRVNPTIQVFPGLPLTESTPDGVFELGVVGAVFESKLTRPYHPGFDRQMAAYAVVIEKTTGKPVDFAVVLHCGFPGEDVSVYHEQIVDSAVQAVERNIALFRDLVLLSIQQRRGADGELAGMGNWRELVVRPPGAPGLDRRESCETCRFRDPCWSEGGIS